MFAERARLRALASGVFVDSHGGIVGYDKARDTWVKHWSAHTYVPSSLNLPSHDPVLARVVPPGYNPIPIYVWRHSNKMYIHISARYDLLKTGEFHTNIVKKSFTNKGKLVDMEFDQSTDSWRMPVNPTNEYQARKIQIVTEKANAELRSKALLFLDPTLGERNKDMVGIISIDINFEPEDWLKAVFPERASWHDHRFPSLEMYGEKNSQENLRVRFYHGGQTRQSINTQLQIVKGWGFTQKLYSYEILWTDRQNQERLNEFLKDTDRSTALVSFATHTKVCFKDTNTKTLKVYDPWKQSGPLNYSWITDILKENSFTRAVYVEHDPDQVNEGSCTLVSMMRALMIVKNDDFEKGIKPLHDLTNTDKLSFIVAAQLLATKGEEATR